MTKPLVVVESPTKIRTLQKYLGNRFNVAATVGHIKDLPPQEMGIDIEGGFKPTYVPINGKQKVIAALKKAASDAEDIYLAPDPDREGEAIAWHTADILKRRGRRFHRVLFHELTSKAILEAMAHPEELHPHKYEAQQARRILDRLVGYQVSPLLWRKVKRGLSAGRVQSVAVRIICERERAIRAFEPEEYWSIAAHLEAGQPPPFVARLIKQHNKKVSIPDETAAQALTDYLSTQTFVVDKVQTRTSHKNPQPPFTTSKLQQEAIRKLRFSAKRTMIVAQQLYEGVDLGPGDPVGLITYMRTDSTRISAEAAQEAIEFICRDTRFGPDYAVKKPRNFANRKKVQDAHEAIRPTAVGHTPESLAAFLNKEQLALYTLIWQRFVASQMQPAIIDTLTILIQAGDCTFSASGTTIKFPGFLALYRSADEESENGDKDKTKLPAVNAKDLLALKRLEPKQHFTQPPPRFSEATLVKELEENGIGRPSTYAAILSTIQDKGYVDSVKGTFHPSELGFIVNDLIVQNFPDVFDVEFTARMEDDLDRVASAEAASLDILSRFYAPFKEHLESAANNMLSMKAHGMATDLDCPDCTTHKLHIKVGRNGEFLACSGYPECRFSSNYTRDEKGHIQIVPTVIQETTERQCPKCGQPLQARQGKFGPFLACSGYPDCRYTESLHANSDSADTGVACPVANCTGRVVQRTSRRGKVFYGCNRYPDCTYAVWDKPLAKKCPNCDFPFLLEKTTKKEGVLHVCPNRDCGFREQAEEER